MLELRPTCENCAVALPPAATNAMICSYECTLCSHCVDGVLDNVCPNCGGGFAPRPIRPSRNWKASTSGRHRRSPSAVDGAEHARFATAIRTLSPSER